MKRSDLISTATTPGVRIFVINSTNLVEELRKMHDCYHLAAAALGRTATGALLLAATMKMGECITIKIAGDGPLGDIVADASNNAVRAYVENPQVVLPLKEEHKLDVAQGVGAGTIIVTRFTGMKDNFTGHCQLKSGEIAEDITEYLYTSEQTPSSVALGVLVSPEGVVQAAGGFLVQGLPDADPEVLETVAKNISQMLPISTLIEQGCTNVEIAKLITAGLPLVVHGGEKVKFACNCSMEKALNIIASLSKEEVQTFIEEGQVEISCHFCNSNYIIGKEQLLDTINSN